MIDVDTVCHHIDALRSANTEQGQAAANWLAEFQKSAESWEIANQLLHNRSGCNASSSPSSASTAGQADCTQFSRSDSACILFAAQTIRMKVLNDFKQLPPDWLVPLRDSIFAHLCRIASNASVKLSSQLPPLGPSQSSPVLMLFNPSGIDRVWPCLVQLSAALADLYIQVPEWTNTFIIEVLNGLIAAAMATTNGTDTNNPDAHQQQQHQSESLTSAGAIAVLLALFKALPEELYNRHLRIGDDLRTALELELATQTNPFFNALDRICAHIMDAANRSILPAAATPAATMMSTDATTVSAASVAVAFQNRAIECLSAWMMNARCPTQLLCESILFRRVFELLKQKQPSPSEHEQQQQQQLLHDAATECVVNSLYLVERPRNHPNLVQLICTEVFATVEAFVAARQAEDLDRLQNYARIYTELCESLLADICSAENNNISATNSCFPLELLLLVLDYHDLSIRVLCNNIIF